MPGACYVMAKSKAGPKIHYHLENPPIASNITMMLSDVWLLIISTYIGTKHVA